MKRTDLASDFVGVVRITATGSGWIEGLPDQPGLYAVVRDREFPRLKGDTDILYMGCAGKPVRERGNEPATLRRRWASRWSFPTYNEVELREVLRELLADGEELIVVFAAGTMEITELERREAQLLDRFFRDHRELPPLNRQKPALK